MSKCMFNRFVLIGSELEWYTNNQSEWLSDVVINAAQALLNVTYKRRIMPISSLCGVLKAPPCIQRTRDYAMV